VRQDKRPNILGPSFHEQQLAAAGSLEEGLADIACLLEGDRCSSLVAEVLRSRLAEGSHRRSFAEGIEDRPGSILGSTL